MDQLRRQVRDEVEKPMRDLLDAANNDADRYRADSTKASRELVVVRSELDQLRAEHCRSVAELKLRLETEVSSRGDAGDKSPRIWSKGTLLQIVPLRFLSYRYKNERSAAFKIRQNSFSAGAMPEPRWGSSRRSPDP